MNKFQKIVKARIRALKIQCDMAGEPRHNATAGLFREKYLTAFLRQMTPSNVILTSGFLLSLEDKISPQIDLIATTPFLLPVIDLHEEISVVPLEAALWGFEVKSVLKSSHLAQVEKRNSWIKNAKIGLQGESKVPTAIIALRGGLSKYAIKDWMQSDRGKNTVLRYW